MRFQENSGARVVAVYPPAMAQGLHVGGTIVMQSASTFVVETIDRDEDGYVRICGRALPASRPA